MSDCYIILRESGEITVLAGVGAGDALHAALGAARAAGVTGWIALVSGSLEYQAHRAVVNCGRIGAPWLNFMRVAELIGRPLDAPATPKRKSKKAAKPQPKLEAFGL